MGVAGEGGTEKRRASQVRNDGVVVEFEVLKCEAGLGEIIHTQTGKKRDYRDWVGGKGKIILLCKATVTLISFSLSPLNTG